MPDYIVTLMTSWEGSGTGADPYRPPALDVKSWSDVTGQPITNLTPAPNVFVIEAVVDDAQLALLEQVDIISVEEIVVDVP